MSVKKLLIMGAASVAAVGASAAFAGGPDHMAMPVAPAFQPNVYLEGHLGYAQSNWKDFLANGVMGASLNTTTGAIFSPTDNGEGGFSGGVDLGYNATQYMAVEGGWMYLPEVKGAHSTTTSRTVAGLANGTTAKVKSWMAYAAAKFSVPVMQHLNLFGKVGVAYRSLEYSLSAAAATAINATNPNLLGKGHYWSPVFAAGLQYMMQNWIMGAQYLYLPGNSSVNRGAPSGDGAPNAAPEVNLYTGFVGYQFNV